MKKIMILLLSLIVCGCFAACTSEQADDLGDDIEQGMDDVEDDVKDAGDKIERSVDSVAEKLGLAGGTQTLYAEIGAEEGKQFNDGTVEIYRFDKQSDEYKAIEAGESELKFAAVNDGMIIMTDDADLAERFKELRFE